MIEEQRRKEEVEEKKCTFQPSRESRQSFVEILETPQMEIESSSEGGKQDESELLSSPSTVEVKAYFEGKPKEAQSPVKLDFGEPENPYGDFLDKRLSEETKKIRESAGTNPEKYPILFVDVNIGESQVERLTVYEGDTPRKVAREFCTTHDLKPSMQNQLETMLEEQMQGLLE